jgi:hypothetical protein
MASGEVAVPGDDGRPVAVASKHERVAPRRGAVDAGEQAALLRPRDQIAMAAHVHGHGDTPLQQGPLLPLLGGPPLDGLHSGSGGTSISASKRCRASSASRSPIA